MNSSSLTDYIGALMLKGENKVSRIEIQMTVQALEALAAVPPNERSAEANEYVQGWHDFLLGDAPKPPNFSTWLGDVSRIDHLEAQNWLTTCKASECSFDATPYYIVRPFAWIYLNFGLRLLGLPEGQDFYFPRKRAAEQAAALTEAMGAAAVAAPVKRGRL